MDSKVLRTFAVLFGILAVSNFTKPLELQPEHGFVLLGRRQSGVANLIAGTAFGLYLAAYAYGLWARRRFALALGILYAGYVPLNCYLFTVRSPEELGANSLFGLLYTLVAVGVSWGAAAVLVRSRDSLS